MENSSSNWPNLAGARQSLSVGFGPQLISFTDSRDTSWKLRSIPIGGSCAIDDKLKDSPADRQADARSALQLLRQRAVILAAGPTFNFAFAISIAFLSQIMCSNCEIFYSEVGSLGATAAQLIGQFSLALALFNLLPLVPLDGGALCLTALGSCWSASVGNRRKTFLFILRDVLDGTNARLSHFDVLKAVRLKRSTYQYCW